MNMNFLMTFLVMLPLAAVLLLSICAYGSLRRLAGFSLPSRHYASAPAPGLDPTAIQRLPVTVIAAETELEPSSAVAVTLTATAKECSVCLSEFREGDKARALPPCGHAFHVECIDSWLIKHSTCPLCRNPVVVPSAPPPPPPASPAESPTSTSADAARMTKAPPSVRGTADVAIHIDADMATFTSRGGEESQRQRPGTSSQ